MILEILIHGTKGDYKIMHQTVGTPAALARDMRRLEGASRNAVGQVAYGICLVPNGCTFTKYLIVLDADPRKVGYVAFTLFLPSTRKMAGGDIQQLLDRLTNEYVCNYVENGTIGQQLDNGSVQYKPEDWAAFSNIAAAFEDKATLCQNIDAEVRPSGTAEPAYVYFADDDELRHYFDAPYQQEYAPFRMVYFLHKGYEGHATNPLGALRCNAEANLTGRIDLNNPRYRVNNFGGVGQNGITIQFSASGRPLRTGSMFYAKEQLRLTYSKNQFYRTCDITGCIGDSRIAQFLTVEGDTVSVRDDVELDKLSLRMPIMLRNGVPGVQLICLDDTKIPKITFDRPEVEFEGEELGYRWCLATPDGQRRTTAFRPMDYISQTIPSVSLELSQCKTVIFNIVDENKKDISQQCKLQIECDGRTVGVKNARHEFVGAEMGKRYILRITCSGYKPFAASFSPAEAGNTANIELVKAASLPEPKDDDNPFGDDFVTPKRVWPKVLAAVILAVALVGGLVWAGIYFFGNHDEEIVLVAPSSVEKYLDGDELQLVKLQQYLDSCVIAVTELSNDVEAQDFLEEYKSLQSRLEAAIEWRTAVDNADFQTVNEKYFPGDSSLYNILKNLKGDMQSTVAEAIVDPAAGTSDLTIVDIDTLIVNVTKLVQLREKFAAGARAAQEPQPAPEAAAATDAPTGEPTGQEFYVNTLRELNALNLPELSMVQDFRQSITAHLTGNVVMEEIEEPKANEPAKTATAQTAKPSNAKKPATPEEKFQADFWRAIGTASTTPDDLDELYKQYRTTAEIKGTAEWNYLADATAAAGRKKFRALTPAARQQAAKSKSLSDIPVK